MKRIIALLPDHRQTLLFSATAPAEIRSLAASFMKDPVEIEVALCKLRCEDEARARVLAVVERHGARAAEDGADRLIVTMHGTSAQVTELLTELRPFNLEELVRSGRIVMDRGASHFAHLLGRRN